MSSPQPTLSPSPSSTTREILLEESSTVLAKLLWLENTLRDNTFIAHESIAIIQEMYRESIYLRRDLFKLWEQLEQHCDMDVDELTRCNTAALRDIASNNNSSNSSNQGLDQIWAGHFVFDLEEVEAVRRMKRASGLRLTVWDLGVPV